MASYKLNKSNTNYNDLIKTQSKDTYTAVPGAKIGKRVLAGHDLVLGLVAEIFFLLLLLLFFFSKQALKTCQKCTFKANLNYF